MTNVLGYAAKGVGQRLEPIHYASPGLGGHFAAFEQPDTFVKEVRAFFRLVR